MQRQGMGEGGGRNSPIPSPRLSPPPPTRYYWMGESKRAPNLNTSPTKNKGISGIQNVEPARSDLVFLGLKGALIVATLKNETRLEGIFDILNQKTKCITLKMVREWIPNCKEPVEHTTREFPLQDLVKLLAESVNFMEITGGTSNTTFATDADIAGHGGGGGGRQRELTRWDDGGGGGDNEFMGGSLQGLEEGTPPPGSGWDQFELNERLFGVTTSFDENIYTTTIDRSSTDYKILEAQAARIAREIENRAVGESNNSHLAEERGVIFDDSQIDEEDRYGAVVRNVTATSPLEKSKAQSSIIKSDDFSSRIVPSPVSYCQAAMRVSKAPHADKIPIVSMPTCTSSQLKTTTSPPPSIPSPATNTLNGEEEGVMMVSRNSKPRKSIANLQVDPEALPAAMEVVESTKECMTRRMSQDPQIGTVINEERRREAFERQKKDTAQQFKAFSEKISCKINSSDSNPSSTPVISPSLSNISIGGGINKLNPNAAAFLPTDGGSTTNHQPAPFQPNPNAQAYVPYQSESYNNPTSGGAQDYFNPYAIMPLLSDPYGGSPGYLYDGPSYYPPPPPQQQQLYYRLPPNYRPHFHADRPE